MIGEGAWRPERFLRREANLRMRGRVIAAVREFFERRDFAEVDTPALQRSPGLEPHLSAFATRLAEPGEGERGLYLHTSPEFAMKKLLAAGMPQIFQLAHAFRNGERGALHHPEFMMLEWYRAHATYRDLMADCEALLRAVAAACGVGAFTRHGAAADAGAPFQYLTVAGAFERYCAIDLFATCPDPHRPSLDLLAGAARRLGIAPHDGDEWEDLFFRIFLAEIEPRLGIGAPAVLYDYPISLAALARAKDGDPRVAERFELYLCGIELANAFGELTDPAEQRRRFAADQAKRRARYGDAYPIDEDFLAALAHLPQCAGIALGLDRLVMLATGAERIDDVLWLPVA